MTRLEAIKNYLDELSVSELVALNNEYCSAINDRDSQVSSMNDFDDAFYNCRPLELVRMLDGNFSADDDYFYIDNYGEICSADNPLDVISIYDIAEYIDDNNDSLYDSELENLLDNWNDDNGNDDEEDDDATDYDFEPDED